MSNFGKVENARLGRSRIDAEVLPSLMDHEPGGSSPLMLELPKNSEKPPTETTDSMVQEGPDIIVFFTLWYKTEPSLTVMRSSSPHWLW